jgi:hypothetical protein
VAHKGPSHWEYQVVTSGDDTDLETLGNAGWELVGVDAGQWYLKRPATSFRDRVTQEQRLRYFASWGIDPDIAPHRERSLS